MIGGFILGRTNESGCAGAIGPSLTQFGLAGALTDTTLDLVNANGEVVLANDDCRTMQEQLIQGTGLAPTDNREAAVCADLAPGAYTFHRARQKTAPRASGSVEVYVTQ